MKKKMFLTMAAVCAIAVATAGCTAKKIKQNPRLRHRQLQNR